MDDHVFICYSRKDEDFVLKLATNLKRQGIPIWLDQWDIPSGANWDRTIEEALRECGRLLLVLSPASVKSDRVQGEWLWAIDKGKKVVVPILYQECNIPIRLASIQYTDFTARSPDDDRPLGQVFRALEKSTPAISVAQRKYEPGKASDWNNKGLAFHNLKKFDEAIKAYDEAIRLDPKDAGAWNNKGWDLYKKTNYGDALEAFNAAIKLDPNSADAWNNKGLTLQKLTKYEEAINAFDKTIRLDPGDSAAWHNKGSVLKTMHGDFLKKNWGIYKPSSSDGFKELQIARGLGYPTRNTDFLLILNAPNLSAGVWNNKGIAFANQKMYDKALTAYNKAIELEPKFSFAWNNKGTVLIDQDKYEEAIQAFDEAIRLDSNNGTAWNNKGIALAHQDKYEEAIQAYNKALELEPTFSKIWVDKGFAFNNLGKYDEAIKAFDKAIKRKFNVADTWFGKGLALYGRKNYNEALKSYDSVITLDPNFSLAWYNKGIVLKTLGRNSEANAAFAKAKELGYKTDSSLPSRLITQIINFDL